MAKARIKREKNWAAGNVTFTDIGSGDTLTCDCEDLFTFYGMDVAAAIAYLESIEDRETPVLNEVQKRGICHLINAKVGDSAADPNDSAVDQMNVTWDALKAGNWSTRGDGTGAGGRISDVIAALFNLAVQNGQDVTESQVADWFNGLPDDGDESKKSWKSRADVGVEIQNIRDARAKARKAKLKAKAKTETPFNLELPATETAESGE